MKIPKSEKYTAISNMDEAVVGYALRDGKMILIYDFTKMVKLVMQRNKLLLDEALQMVEEEMETAWIGEGTPAIMHRMNMAEIEEIFGGETKRTVN
jgi:hypothetical protein